MSESQAERVAVLEEQNRYDKATIDRLTNRVTYIERELNRYKGFIGAITLIASGLVTVIGLFGGWFKDHLK